MNRLLSLAVLALLFVTSACNAPENKEQESTKELEPKEELIQKIKTLEEKVYSADIESINPAVARELLTVYQGYANANPLDKMTPEYLFKAGSVARGLKEYEQAIRIYKRIVKDYPGYQRKVESLFLIAFTYDHSLEQKGLAKTFYQQVIEDHPESKFATDAKSSIENLLLTDEELIKRFQEQNKSS